MADEQRKPDAYLYHESLKRGRTMVERLTNDRQRLGTPTGQQAWSTRGIGNGWWFATPKASDSFLFPIDHPRAKEPRYDWEDMEEGLKRGFLKPDEPEPTPNK